MEKYNENDEIEIRLVHDIADHYFLEWRFKKPRKFLFFRVADKWKKIHYYNPGIFNVDDDPNDDMYWYWRGFRLGNKSDVQEYEKLKSIVRTQKDLFGYYHVKENMEWYSRNLREYRRWVEEVNATIGKLVGK
jgi:hypothetical protein